MQDVSTLFEILGVNVSEGCQVIDAALLAEHYYPPFNVGLPLLILNVNSQRMAADLQSTLLAAYPAGHGVLIVPSGARSADSQLPVSLEALANRGDYTSNSNLYVPPLPRGHDFADLQETVAHLRSPVGCPWDREQTLASLRSDLLSECTEVLEAIDLDGEFDNGAHIAEELGDVLLLVTMMVQIAIDDRRFQMADVADHIVSKLVRRHPHVFGDVDVAGSGEVKANWDAIKAQERADKGQVVSSPLDGIPAALPSLEKAREVQSKAAKAGILDRALLAESIPPLSKCVGTDPDDEAVGRVLWVLTALAREHGVIAEDALRAYAVRYRDEIEKELLAG